LLVDKQYLTNYELEGDEGRLRAAALWKGQSRALAQRQQGISGSAASYKPARKRRRVKAYMAIMQINNILVQMAKKSWLNYRIVPLVDGTYPDPFAWEHLNLTTDMAANMVATDSFLAYEAEMNVNLDYDLSHGSMNCGKGALHECDLYKHVVIMCAAGNCAHGSTLSPPRLQQFRECTLEYLDEANPETDEHFQLALPLLVKQLDIQIDLSDPSCARVPCRRWRVCTGANEMSMLNTSQHTTHNTFI
jgi:hypothetical protein